MTGRGPRPAFGAGRLRQLGCPISPVIRVIHLQVMADRDRGWCRSAHGSPHGIFDVAKNEASVHLNGSCDTAELACDSIELWSHEQGHSDYP